MSQFLVILFLPCVAFHWSDHLLLQSGIHLKINAETVITSNKITINTSNSMALNELFTFKTLQNSLEILASPI